MRPGERLGSYELIDLVGAGGMGEVWRAIDSGLGRHVAIKVLSPGFSRDPDRLRRFELEARAAGMLNHPNVLAIYAVGKHGDSPFGIVARRSPLIVISRHVILDFSCVWYAIHRIRRRSDGRPRAPGSALSPWQASG